LRTYVFENRTAKVAENFRFQIPDFQILGDLQGKVAIASKKIFFSKIYRKAGGKQH